MRRLLTTLAACGLASTAACHSAATSPDADLGSEPPPPVESQAGLGADNTGSAVADDPSNAAEPAIVGDLTRGAQSIRDLSNGLGGALSSGAGNVLYSPYSVSAALHLALLGANGATAEAIATAIAAPTDRSAHANAAVLADALASDGSDGTPSFRIANRFYLEETARPRLRPNYAHQAQRIYGAQTGWVDFAGAPEDARRTINAWVAEQTADMIPELLPGGSVRPDTLAVLVNAIHFLGDWRVPFDRSRTTTEAFHLLDGGTIDVPLMHQTDRMAYASTADAQHVVLPYEGGEWSLHVILPREGRFEAVERELHAGALYDTSRFERREVALALPRFEATWRGSLLGPLGVLGMGPAFADNADFSNLLTGGGVTISDVIHEAVIVVDERGTEAAAATGVMMRTTSMPAPPEPMRVDRPFFLVLTHGPTTTPLFVGRIVVPEPARDR
jgi:serpin B